LHLPLSLSTSLPTSLTPLSHVHSHVPYCFLSFPLFFCLGSHFYFPSCFHFTSCFLLSLPLSFPTSTSPFLFPFVFYFPSHFPFLPPICPIPPPFPTFTS
jgi:hypothetical protein